MCEILNSLYFNYYVILPFYSYQQNSRRIIIILAATFATFVFEYSFSNFVCLYEAKYNSAIMFIDCGLKVQGFFYPQDIRREAYQEVNVF